VRRAREAAELESLKAHPAVRAVLDAFPEAKIAAVRPIEMTDEEGSGGESEVG
jgi:DNA polymerase-3 subunit gamma/tau